MNDLAELHATCASEPIHIPGSVQPHGLLLALSPGLEIRAASESAADILGISAASLLGRPLTEFIGARAASQIAAAAIAFQKAPGQPVLCVLEDLPAGLALDCQVHVRDDLVMVDAERPVRLASCEQLVHTATRELSRLRKLDDPVEICRGIAALTRQMTGFDRVMIYRFDADWNGEVIAEDVVSGRKSFLHLHFPASDIPVQARNLYVSTVVRQLPDVRYVPSPILALPGMGPVDLSDSCLRSVSPMHVQYLSNMGVRATLVGSILRDGELWGLLVCHHDDEPRPVARPLRDLFQWICEDTSAMVTVAEGRAQQTRASGIEVLRRRLLDSAHAAGLDGLLEVADPSDLLAIVQADGFALIGGQTSRCVGLAPSAAALQRLRTALLPRFDSEGVFASHRLADELGWSDQGSSVAGAIAISMMKHHDSILVWFRASRERSMRWGGDPNQAAVVDAQGMLSPRNSFAQFLQIIAGQSLAWRSEELEVARRLTELIEIDHQHALRQRAALLHQALTHLNDMVLIVETGSEPFAERSIVVVSEIAAQVTGYAPEELVGRRLSLLFGPLTDQTVQDGLQRTLSEGRQSCVELQIYAKDGRCFWAEIDVAPVGVDGGATTHFVALLRDITERRASMADLHINREMLKRTGRLAGIGGWELNLHTGSLFWSDETRRIHGLEPEYQPSLDQAIALYGPGVGERLEAAVDAAIASGTGFDLELPYLRHDGCKLWMRVVGSVELEGGVPARLIGAFQDVTERHGEQAALSAVRERLLIATQSAEIGIWDWDVVEGSLIWDTRMKAIFGVSPSDDTASTQVRWRRSLHPEDLPAVESAVAAALNGGMPFNTEFRILWPDGSIHHVRSTAIVTDHSQGKGVRMVGCSWEVTHERRRELALRSFRENAEAEADLARFLLSRLSRIERLNEAGVAYYWQPADAFSGDVIAIARSSTGDLYGMLADATGHGLAAAINVVPLTSVFYAMAQKGFNLVSIAEQMNKVVKDYSPADRFVALTLTRLLYRERQIEIINAGNPPALLVDRQRTVVRSFNSACVPLGVLDRQGFRPKLELAELETDASLLLYSDGLIEACDPAGRSFGIPRLLGAIKGAEDCDTLVSIIRNALEAHFAGVSPHDDVTLLQLRQRDLDSDNHVDTELQGSPAPVLAPASAERLAEDRLDWDFAVVFSYAQLQRVDVVPVIVGLARTLGLSTQVEARVFTIVSELVANSLEHGLLELDSAIKQAEDGFERYFSLRSERLAALSEGSIDIRLRHWQRGETSGRLRVEVVDTGGGFDYQNFLLRLSATDPVNQHLKPSGRGIALLRAFCDQVTYRDRGNSVTVEFLYD